MNKYKIVLTTCSTKNEANNIAKALITEQLAACVNIINNCTSIYTWKNKTEVSDEFLLLIKTNNSKIDKLFNKIKELHSYDTPELVSFELNDIDSKYKNWLESIL